MEKQTVEKSQNASAEHKDHKGPASTPNGHIARNIKEK